MSLQVLLNLITQAIYLFIAGSAALAWARWRDRSRRDVALVFGALAVAIIAQDLQLLFPAARPALALGFFLGLLVQPYLLLRVISYFQPVSRRARRLALGGLAVTGGALLLTPVAPALVAAVFLLYFVAATSGATYLLARGARTQAGIIRQRLRLAALGAGLLGLVFTLTFMVLLVELLVGMPAAVREATGPLLQLIAIFSGLGYYLGFAPPRWLRRSWQYAEVHRFLRTSGGRPAAERARSALNDLAEAGLRAVGGQAAAAAMWDEGAQALRLRPLLRLAGALEGERAADGVVLQAWGAHAPALASTPEAMGAAVARLAQTAECSAALAAPIVGSDRAWGVLLIFRMEPSLFPADDLAMLGLLAEQCAAALDYDHLLNSQSALIEELRQRTIQLEAANAELEAFAYSTSHDLRAPLRAIDGFSQAVLEDYGPRLDAEGQDYLGRIRAAAQRMGELIDALLGLSRVTRTELRQEPVDLGALARAVAAEMARAHPDRQVQLVVAEDLKAQGDARLLRVVLDNLLANAWKFTRHQPEARVEVGRLRPPASHVYYVRDNGAGFDTAYAHRLFKVFQRLHSAADFAGTGIGLATVQRVIARHGGQVCAEGVVGQGATFYFSLPAAT